MAVVEGAGGGGVSSDTLVYNSGASRELATQIANRVTQVEDAVEQMFTIINNKMSQPDHWSGPSLEDLKEKCNAFRKTEIEDKVSRVKSYSNHFNKAGDSMDENDTRVKGIVTRDAIDNANLINKEVQ